MENEQEEIVTTPEVDDTEIELDLEETQEESPAEVVPVEKPKETPEARLARLRRQTAQLEKHLGITKDKPESNVPSKSNDFGYAEKAFLIANDIKVDELPMVQELIKKTGMSLEEVISDDYAQAKLKAFRETKASKEAIPTGTKRSSPSIKDSADYWVKKPFNEVPDEMRIAVVNKRLELEKSKNPFAK